MKIAGCNMRLRQDSTKQDRGEESENERGQTRIREGQRWKPRVDLKVLPITMCTDDSAVACFRILLFFEEGDVSIHQPN